MLTTAYTNPKSEFGSRLRIRCQLLTASSRSKPSCVTGVARCIKQFSIPPTHSRCGSYWTLHFFTQHRCIWMSLKREELVSWASPRMERQNSQIRRHEDSLVATKDSGKRTQRSPDAYLLYECTIVAVERIKPRLKVAIRSVRIEVKWDICNFVVVLHGLLDMFADRTVSLADIQ